MNIKYLLPGLCCVLVLVSRAQNITPVLINIKQLSDLEIKHTDLFKHCSTCREKEADGGWKELRDMQVPKNAILKKQSTGIITPGTANRPQTASPTPYQTFLGHIDPGQSIPPDTHGAIGPNHVVTATNDFLIVHTKTGTELSRVSINNFTGIPNTCDPYIQYDPASHRWFYVAIDCAGQNNNSVALLVSASDDPGGNWFRYSYIPTLPGGAFFLDHPYIGFDNRWIVVSGRKFPDAASRVI